MTKSRHATLAALVLGVLCLATPVGAQEVKAVLFDSYGTLVSWEGVESKVAEVMDRKGVAVDASAFNALWRSKQLLYVLYATLADKGFEPFSYVTRRKRTSWWLYGTISSPTRT